jgi:hypothetical protein
MNTAKYNTPKKMKREIVSLETFCNDCEKNKETCGKNVIDCLKEANIYKEFVKVDNNE